jgi:hypothetical protein
MEGDGIMEKQKKQWEPTAIKELKKPAGTSIVKAAGCMSCWASKSISMTRVCWLPHPAMRLL